MLITSVSWTLVLFPAVHLWLVAKSRVSLFCLCFKIMSLHENLGRSPVVKAHATFKGRPADMACFKGRSDR